MTRTETKQTLIIHVNHFDSLLALPPEDMKIMLQAMRDYAFFPEKAVNIPEHLQIGWIFFRDAVDYDDRRYQAKANKRNKTNKR